VSSSTDDRPDPSERFRADLAGYLANRSGRELDDVTEVNWSNMTMELDICGSCDHSRPGPS
jgi:hypothetical protein